MENLEDVIRLCCFFIYRESW